MGEELVVNGYIVLKDRLYTGNDEWVKREDGKVKIGITDYAQKQLKDIVGIDLPETGQKVKKGEPIATIDSIKTAAEVYSPVTGVIVDVNEVLLENPEFLNTDPYGEGWIAVIEGEKIEEEVETLMTPEKYADYIKRRGD